MNDEMREAFCNWLETEHGVKPIEGIAIDALANMTNPQLFAGFQAAYQLQQSKLEKAIEALEDISHYKNWRQNCHNEKGEIAWEWNRPESLIVLIQQTLAEIKGVAE